MVRAVVGANWGDEGKGKITDFLACESDIVIRFQGGSNAGHTIVNNYGKFAMHQLPSGVFNSHTMNIIGNGVALSVENFVQEMDMLKQRAVPAPHVMISNRAQVVMPYHVMFDEYEEERLSDRSFGSTKSGIAPFYSDKVGKIGFQVSELFGDAADLKQKIEHVLSIKNALLKELYGKEAIHSDTVYNKLMEYRDIINPFVGDSFAYIHEALGSGKSILLEGQLGALKDVDFGIYPMVTSSNTIAGYGTVGAGIPPYEIGEIITVVKAYSSAVGAGEFVSEIFGEEADVLRNYGGDGGEFGATTGRARRMGWLDIVASRYGCLVQGATSVAFTVLDVLGYLDEIPVCVAYELDGKKIKDFPTTDMLKRAKPVYEVLPGWKSDIRGIRNFKDLPLNCRKYIQFVEKELGFPIKMISNGPSRDDIIHI